MEFAARDPDVFVKLEPLFLPIFEQLHPLLRPAKIFELHLFELARSKSEIARINFVAECFSDLRNPERQFLPRHIEDIFELNEDRLRRFRTEISDARFVFSRADVSFEHQIERARLSQIFPATNRTLLLAFLINDLIGT